MEKRYSAALVRLPGPNLAQGIGDSNAGQPDYELACEQHKQYCAALESCGLEVIKLSYDQRYPDGCFVEDTAVIVNGSAIVTNPGHPSRKGEIEEIAKVLGTKLSLHYIKAPGTLDGGDVLRVNNHFFIGLTDRTNVDGASQLTALLNELGATASTVDASGLLHLKSGVTCIDQDTVICVDQFSREKCFSHLRQIVVPREEAHAANCLSVNDTILAPADCPIAQAKLQRLGMRVVPLHLSEFRKLNGLFTCLSLLL